MSSRYEHPHRCVRVLEQPNPCGACAALLLSSPPKMIAASGFSGPVILTFLCVSVTEQFWSPPSLHSKAACSQLSHYISPFRVSCGAQGSKKQPLPYLHPLFELFYDPTPNPLSNVEASHRCTIDSKNKLYYPSNTPFPTPPTTPSDEQASPLSSNVYQLP